MLTGSTYSSSSLILILGAPDLTVPTTESSFFLGLNLGFSTPLLPYSSFCSLAFATHEFLPGADSFSFLAFASAFSFLIRSSSSRIFSIEGSRLFFLLTGSETLISTLLPDLLSMAERSSSRSLFTFSFLTPTALITMRLSGL